MGNRHGNMRHSVHQFKALFWKNWLCRLRQPVLSLSEVLWPCILFLILAAIRIQQPPEHKENCYLEARDLPSRGLYPFVQSLFCNVGSRCKNSSYTPQKRYSFRTSSFPGSQDSFMGTDLTFLKEIQDLAVGISELSEKATALQKLWKEESNVPGSINCSTFLTMDLNETEEMISAVERLYSQTDFWDFLNSLPGLQASKEDGINATAQFLQIIKNSFISLEDLDVVPSNQNFYEAVKIGLNVTITVLRFLENWSFEGPRYNLTLWDLAWDPHAVKMELKSRFGLDDLHIGKILNYTVELNKVFKQGFSSSEPQKFLFELGRSMANLVSQYPDDNEAKKIISAINILMQHVSPNLELNFPEKIHESQNVVLYLDKLRTVIQSLPQCPFVKRVLLVDGAIRNVIIQKLYFTKEILHNLEKLKPFIEKDGFMHLDLETLFLELKQILMSNTSCVCKDLLTMFDKAVQLPQDFKVREILAGIVCHHNYSNDSFELSNQIQSVKKSVLLLQKVLLGEQNLPDSIKEEYLGWKEIEQQLTENSAVYCKINQLLGTKAPSQDEVCVHSCQKQLLLSLAICTLEEMWVEFEADPYWKHLTTFVRRTCEIAQYVNKEEGFTRGHSNDTEMSVCSGEKLSLKVIIDSYLAFLQNLSNSTFPSWTRILTPVKELLKKENNIDVLQEEDFLFILHLAELIQEMLMSDSLAPSSLHDLQSLTEIVLNNAIMWLNASANMESATEFRKYMNISNDILENYQLLVRLRQNEQQEVFWQVVKKVLDQLEHQMFGSQVEAAELLKMFLSKTMLSLWENPNLVSKRLPVFQKTLTDWPELSFVALDYVNNFTEEFLWNLYEVGVLTEEHFPAAFSTHHAMRNVSSVLVSNTTSISQVQDVGKIVSNFYESIPEVGNSNAASLVQMLFSVYQNIDELSSQSNSSLLSLFQNISEDMSSTLEQLDFQNMSEVLGFISEVVNLFQSLPQKPLCAKLAAVYNYIQLQAQNLAQKEKGEIEVVYRTMESLKTAIIDTELHAAAFQYLKQLFDISSENMLNNECADCYMPNTSSLRQARELHTSLVLPLVRVLSNTSNFKSELNVPFAMHCTATWLQMWTEILEEISEILKLDLNFFSDLRNGLTQFSEDLENITHAELCNTTFTISAEMTSAIYLLKVITEAYNFNEWKDSEILGQFISKLSNAIDVIRSIKRENLEEAFQTIENATVELQKSLLEVNVSREVLDFWFDVFFPLSSKVKSGDTHVNIIGHSLSDILTLSGEEFGTVFTQLRETAEFLKNISQDQYLVSCMIIFQNVTSFVLEDILKEKNVSHVSFLSHLNPLLTSDNLVNVVEGYKRWIHIISSLSEKYIACSHLGNAKHVLFLLTSLGTHNETKTNLKNTLDFVNLTFNLTESPCFLNGFDAQCADTYFSIVAKILKVLPAFSDKNDRMIHDFIFTLLNVLMDQIQATVKDVMSFLQYAFDSEQMHFTKLITGAIKNSREISNLSQSLQPSSEALLRRIQPFLKNITSEILQNSSSPSDAVNLLLNTFEALPQNKNMSPLRKSFQHLISYIMSNLPHNILRMQNITLQTWMKAADLKVELVRKLLDILKSNNLTNLATLVKNTENEDVEFLIDQLKQISKSLRRFFKNIKVLYTENSFLGKLTGWLDFFKNNSYSWNLTNLWQITQLFHETELHDILQVLDLLPDGVHLIQRLVHKNITDALIEVYTFVSAQEANTSIVTKEDLSNKVDNFLELLEVVTNMPEESARTLSCLTAIICRNLTVTMPQNDSALRTCHLNAYTNFSSVYITIANVLEQLRLTIPGKHSLCSNEDDLREISYRMTCFFHRFKEWNSILLKLSEIHNINSLALKELLKFWNKLSVHVLVFGNSSTISVYCPSTPKRRAALQLVEALNNVSSTEMANARVIFEHLTDFYGALNLDRSTGMSAINTLLTYLKSMAKEISGVLDNEDTLSFLSAAQPLLTLSPVGNQTYMVLTALSALSRNSNLIGDLEALWLDTERDLQDLLVNFSVQHLLSVMDKEVQLLSTASRKKSSLALASLLKPFNSSSLETLLRNFEDFQEVVGDWLHEYTNKNFSRVINALFVLMANEKSSDDIVLFINDIIEFLELFRNGSKQDHIDISFVTDLLSGEKLNNVHIAHVILQNSLLNMVSDLTTEEETLHLNDTDLQIMDFIDLFFDDVQYDNYGKEITPFQNKIVQMIKEFLKIFPSSRDHYRNKIFVLLKSLHEDIIAEMRIFPKDDTGTLISFNQSVNLKEQVDELKENIYELIKDAAISENGTLHFYSAKGLNFTRNLYNFLFKDFSVKNGSRRNSELFTFVSQMLFNDSNSEDLVQLTRDFSKTLQLMRQTSLEMGRFKHIFNSYFKDFLVNYPILQEMVLANISELLDSVDKTLPLEDRQLTEIREKLLGLIFWSRESNYTSSPFPEIAVDLRSLWASNKFVKLAKIVEVIVNFLTLSKQVSEKVANILESSINSHAVENLDYIEMVFSNLQGAVYGAVERLTEVETAEGLHSNQHQVADTVKAFLDLTYLSMQAKHSNSYGSETANTSTALVANLSELNDLNGIAGEITRSLANMQKYSTELERFAAIVTSVSINSTDDAVSLIEDLLDFFVPINDIISKIHLTSALNFTHDPMKGEKWERIQEAITCLCKRNMTEIKASVRGIAQPFLRTFCKNQWNESKLNLLLPFTHNQDDILKALKVIMESFKLMKNISGGSFNPRSFFASLINQVVAHQQKEESSWETMIEATLNRTNPWIELLHSSSSQQVNSTGALLQAVMELFSEGTTGTTDVAQLKTRVLRMMYYFDLIFHPLSAYEKYGRQLAYLAEYLRQGSLKEQRVSAMCQVFQKHLSPSYAQLLQRVQIMAWSVFTAFSENPTVISNLLCAFTNCQGDPTRRFLLSAIEGISSVHKQYQERETMWSASSEGYCENLLYANKKLASAVESFLRTLQNTTCSSCEHQLTFEHIQKHIQMLAGNLGESLSGNPVVAFLSNFSLPNDLKIKDCVQNASELALRLRSSVGLSEETVDTLLESSTSHSKFLSSALGVALAGRCDEEVLSLLLTFPANGKTSLAVKELCSLPALDLYTMIVLIAQNLNLRDITYKVMLPSEVNKLLNVLLEVVSSISSLLNKVQHILESLPMFLQTFRSNNVLDVSAFQQVGKTRSSVVGSLQSLIGAVCKEESSFFSNTNMFIDMPRTTELLEDDMAKYSIPQDSTPFCLQLYQEILQSPNGALIWTFLKPLLHGKILYTPNSKEFNMVIEKANLTFGFVEKLKIYSETWLRTSEVFKNSENFFNISQFQESVQSGFIKNLIKRHLNIDVEELIGKLQEYEPMMDKMLNNSAMEQMNVLAQLMVNISSCVLLDRFQHLESVEELEEKAQELMQQNNFLASIIFNTSSNRRQRRDSANHLPQHISYTIRTSVLYSMRTDLVKNPMWKSHPQHLPGDGFKYNHIFIPLQDLIERAIIAVHTGENASKPEIQVQAMPYPCHTSDLFLNNIGFFFPFIMMITWMISVAGMVRQLVYEREIHLEEYMKTMGVNPAIHFLAWFLENVIMLTISSCALVIILKASSIFAFSDGFLVFLFLLDFAVAVVTLSYLLGAFFSNANTAALCASLIYMISFLPYIVLLVLQNQLSFAYQIIACFLPTTAFGQGLFFITFFESQEIGIQWSNIYQPLAEGESMTFGWAFWMIFFDSFIYLLVGWYFSNVIPGRLAFRKPWYFPFTVSYWKKLCGTEKRRKHFLNPNMVFFNEHFFEKGSLPQDEKHISEGGTPTGVMLVSLTKEYKDNKKTAVKDLNLTFYQNQITALLGANGAGKTTIISMLTGLNPPSSGTIVVNGRDIHTDLDTIRMEMGLCPQYDVLFDTLTVREHLLFYGSVKAPQWSNRQLHQQVSRALDDVDLSHHKHEHVGALSGGMKRRLSVAISFIGNSKTVVLDEPTSGVDPCSRRKIWDILLKYRTGRTLIFTTHHLDEAEVLSDHIAILQHGQLRCYGPPSYLKETYGQGYSLTLIKKPSVFEIQDPKNTVQVTSLVQSYVPEAFLKENSGSELTYVIPAKADKASFKGLFQAMDENLEYLHVIGYGISDTTLEEVFLKLLQDTEKMPQVPLSVDSGLSDVNSCEPTYQNCNSLMDAQSMHGPILVLSQIAALLMKQFQHTRRDGKGTVSNVLLPVLFVAMAMALFTVKPLAIDYPSLKLMPGLYDKAESSFFSTESDDLGNLSYVLQRDFSGQDHPCTYSRQDVQNDSCWQTELNPPDFLDACGCVMDHQKCPSFNVSVAYLKNRKGHILYNLSGLNMEEYLIIPTGNARYGGWSFGVKTSELQDLNLNKTSSKPLAKVWYSQKGFHSLPSYLNQLNNLILWLNLPPSVDWRQYGITLYSHPYGGALLDEDKIMENIRQCGVALCIMLGFSILTASIGSSVVKDRVSGAKRLQHISGLGYRTYWFANFLYDMLFYLVPVGLCICVIAAFQLSAFTFRENLAATALLLILFGYATLPWMYLMSRFFSSSDIAFICYISLNFVFGLCTMLATLLPHLLAVISKTQSFQNIYNILKWAFIVFPQFCLGQGLLELSYNQIKFDLTNSFGIDSYVSPFEMNFLGWIFVAMALQGTVMLLLRVLLHWDLLQKTRTHSSISSTVNPSEDMDVQMEQKRLFGGRTQNDILLLYNLRKCYRGFSKRKTAVKDISLGIPRRECFGLLGANGAGKSTTFKMLTGDITPSGGCAIIRTPTGSEMDILSAISEGILIGYCPQQDALDELLTGREHLYYYCTLHGVPKKCIPKVAGDLVSRLHLDAHIDKLVSTYSGGTKRKLSSALALVGKPQILLLDEPSTGMDPCSKRYLWKAIMKEVQDGCAAVLTSHSMEECEALCTRLAIMVNGSFRCLGSPQHIKNRFGDGYSVKIWLSKETSHHSTVLDYLKLNFPGTQFKGQHLNLQEYHVPYRWGCLPELFKVLENHKVLQQIKHYSISQTTLEQVFLNFATQQEEASYSAEYSSTNHHHHLPA